VARSSARITLSCGKSIRLDDDGCAHLPEVSKGGLRLGEGPISGGWNTVAGEKVLGEGLGALDPCGISGGSEAGQTGSLKGVDHARHQRCFWAYDGEPDSVTAGPGHQGFDVVRGDVQIFHPRLHRGTAVSRGHEDLFHQR